MLPIGTLIRQVIFLELVPENLRGRWTSIRTLLEPLIGVPAPMIGSLLYIHVHPAAPFLVHIAIDALLMMPLLSTIPETLKKKNLDNT